MAPMPKSLRIYTSGRMQYSHRAWKEVIIVAQGQRGNRALVPQATQALDSFKYQVAAEIGITPPQGGYWGDLPARQCGAVGGHMVRRMIQLAEQQLAGGAAAPAAGFGAATQPRGAGTARA